MRSQNSPQNVEHGWGERPEAANLPGYMDQSPERCGRSDSAPNRDPGTSPFGSERKSSCARGPA